MREALQEEPGTLFVCSCYSIGKERAYLGAAAALGLKVSPDRLQCRLLALSLLPATLPANALMLLVATHTHTTAQRVPILSLHPLAPLGRAPAATELLLMGVDMAEQRRLLEDAERRQRLKRSLQLQAEAKAKARRQRRRNAASGDTAR